MRLSARKTSSGDVDNDTHQVRNLGGGGGGGGVDGRASKILLVEVVLVLSTKYLSKHFKLSMKLDQFRPTYRYCRAAT